MSYGMVPEACLLALMVMLLTAYIMDRRKRSFLRQVRYKRMRKVPSIHMPVFLDGLFIHFKGQLLVQHFSFQQLYLLYRLLHRY